VLLEALGDAVALGHLVTFLPRGGSFQTRPMNRRRCDRRSDSKEDSSMDTATAPVLVTGGTGTLGRPGVPRPRDAGHVADSVGTSAATTASRPERREVSA
jgi:hypothetical protein